MAKAQKGRGSKIPKDETKEARFIRVVSPRVNKAVKAIKVIGYCASSTYDYTAKQIQQIIGALNAAVVEIDNRFTAKEEKQSDFDFED